jgi:hypothetical protein
MVSEILVETRNKVNAAALQLHAELAAALEPLRGSKVIKTLPKSAWSKKTLETIEPIVERFKEEGFRVIFKFSKAMVMVTIDTTYPVNEGVNYVETYFGMIFVHRDIMASTCPAPEIKTDYTVEKVVEAKNKIIFLQGQIAQLEDSIREFV